MVVECLGIPKSDCKTIELVGLVNIDQKYRRVVFKDRFVIGPKKPRPHAIQEESLESDPVNPNDVRKVAYNCVADTI